MRWLTHRWAQAAGLDALDDNGFQSFAVLAVLVQYQDDKDVNQLQTMTAMTKEDPDGE